MRPATRFTVGDNREHGGHVKFFWVGVNGVCWGDFEAALDYFAWVEDFGWSPVGTRMNPWTGEEKWN